jgi:anti-anti-sigma factor
MRKKQTFASIQHLGWVTQIGVERSAVSDTRHVADLKECIQQAMDNHSARNLLVDFSQVESISTAALGMLLKLQKHLFEHGGRLKLYAIDRDKIIDCVNDTYLHEIFKIFELDRFFDIVLQSQQTITECVAGMNHHRNPRLDSSASHQAISC